MRAKRVGAIARSALSRTSLPGCEALHTVAVNSLTAGSSGSLIGIMDVYFTVRSAPFGELRDRVSWLESHGAAGVFAADHLFVADGGSRANARRGSDPIVLLSTIAALSDKLTVGTSVSNIGFLHPALVLRQFAQLARLFGGERVYAGLGAGWNREEFEALGLPWQAHGQRMQRLEETMVLGRQLFDDGYGHLHGAEIVADDLPLSPDPGVPPRLMIGGGSARALQMA